MIYVFEMSTDRDIRGTPLHENWVAETACYRWAEVNEKTLNVPRSEVLVVIAHGCDREIGNKQIETIDIAPETFIQLVQENLNAGQTPAAIYISTRKEEVTEFAAAVVALLPPGDWQNTEIYGHSKPMDGSVPSGKRAPVTELVRRRLTWTYPGEARPS